MALKPLPVGLVAGGVGLVTGLLLNGSSSSQPAAHFETVLSQEVSGAMQGNEFDADGNLLLQAIHDATGALVLANMQIGYATAGSTDLEPTSPQMKASEECGTALASELHVPNKAKLDFLGGLAAVNGDSSGKKPANAQFTDAANICASVVQQATNGQRTIRVPVGLAH